jgi:16S rRNA (adenine1518-N6/adenine1519-N6)-dimethyltransferase
MTKKLLIMAKVSRLIHEAGIIPKKSLGQNFLVNEGIYKKIVYALSAKSSDTIVEVGPGLGTLTDHLAATGANIIAIEKDDKLFEYLKKKFRDVDHVQIIHNDILKFNPSDYKLSTMSYKLVGNIPFYLTSHLIQIVLDSSISGWPTPERIVFMIQKEVAQRMTAKPPKMNLLAVSVQYFSKPEIVAKVSKGSFLPVPKVDSAIIRLTPKIDNNQGLLADDESKNFFRVVKAGFSNSRKQLANNIASGLHLPKSEVIAKLSSINIAHERRAETLTLDEWQKISNIF